MKGNVIRLAAAVLLVLSLGLAVCAHDVPDMDRLGSITVTLRLEDVPLDSGTLTLYRVGEVAENDGNYSFQPAGDFAQCGESFEDLGNTALASYLLIYAADNAITGHTQQVEADGTVTFENLPVGLYLIAQHKATAGYKAMAPFLVSLPYMSDGVYQYDLSANPKAELEREPEPTQTQPPDEEKLPQTGMLWWPVPVLACAGLVFLGVGVALKRRYSADER